MKLAPCGLVCDTCSEYLGNCDGCHADSVHLWDADCPIRTCCKFEKKLSNCSLCEEFPCNTILEFESDQWDHHTTAVAKLRQMNMQGRQ